MTYRARVMCDYYMQKVKPGKCKAIPAHTTEMEVVKNYCKDAPGSGKMCGSPNKVDGGASALLTISEAGENCAQCGD